MYKHPGKEIKRNASILTNLIVIPSVLLGFLAFVLGLLQGEIEGILAGFIVGAVIIAVSIWWARVFGSVLYGFGVVVECAETMMPEAADVE